MRAKITISALLFSLYFQGLDLYFYITSLINFKPIWLTGLYQILLLTLLLFSILFIPNSRKKLFSIELSEILYASFFGLVILDLIFFKNNFLVPENLIVYFSVYSFSLVLARGLTFEQLKLVCYFTTFIAIVTSFLLLLQFINGTASYTKDGVRLVTGLAGNPINTGYLGAYTFLSSLTLLIKSTSLLAKSLFFSTSLLGLSVAIFSGTRSSFIFIILGFIVLMSTSFILNIKNNEFSSDANFDPIIYKNKIFLSLKSSFFYFGLSLSIILLIFTFDKIKFYLIYFIALVENPWNRINDHLLFIFTQNRVSPLVLDKSTMERAEFYKDSLHVFLRHPILGGGLYSTGTTHNAFLQSASDFGIFGIITFCLPFIYLGYRVFTLLISNVFYKSNYFRSNYWMINIFCLIIFLESFCLFCFHGDPYRNYIALCGMGILISFCRLKKAV